MLQDVMRIDPLGSGWWQSVWRELILLKIGEALNSVTSLPQWELAPALCVPAHTTLHLLWEKVHPHLPPTIGDCPSPMQTTDLSATQALSVLKVAFACPLWLSYLVDRHAGKVNYSCFPKSWFSHLPHTHTHTHELPHCHHADHPPSSRLSLSATL